MAGRSPRDFPDEGLTEGCECFDFLGPRGLFLGTLYLLMLSRSKQENACTGSESAESSKMNFLPADNASTRKKASAFTLIELLVVIAIIAILMGLLFPAAQPAINSAKKTTAKNQAVQIVTAITAYEAEYGRLPAFSGSTMISSNVNMLTANDAVNNPRAVLFLDSSTWKSGKGGITTNGSFADPWGNVYSVSLDTNYVNQITVPTNASGTTATLTKHVGVWTMWTNTSQTNLINSWD